MIAQTTEWNEWAYGTRAKDPDEGWKKKLFQSRTMIGNKKKKEW